MNKKLFVSAVSSEFESYRKLLAGDLKRPTLDVAVQEDFVVTDGTTLQKLDTYIRASDGVVHLIGKAVGAVPEAVAVTALLRLYPDLSTKLPALEEALVLPDPGFSYTQWEAYLAIYHNRPIFVYRPSDFELVVCECPREDRFQHDPAQEQAQREHYQRICAMGRDRGQFLNPERLSSAVLRDLVDILPALENRIDVPPTRLTHTAETLVGREHELTVLDKAWNDPHIHLVVVRGKGGEGKTSLVAAWMAELAFKDWRGAERVIDWSFYSQGTRDQTSATAEFFINQTLTDLGDPDPNAGGAEDRATRLAKLINDRKTLLVLDGLEPLQYPPGAMHGALKDAGMAALLKALVAQNSGLVVVTTREKVVEVQQHYGRSATDHDLTFLSPLAGAQVLYNAGARRASDSKIEPDDEELQQASREVQGHAVTLFLVGQYLRLAEDGDIRKRDRMSLAEADQQYSNDSTRPYGHAFKAIEAYEKWFAAGDLQAQLQLSVLRIMGLFDRPASGECLKSLRTTEIDGITNAWNHQSEREWRMTLSRLKEINLIEVSDNFTIDCHPLIREYFAMQLVTRFPDAFAAAHSRLFDYLCDTNQHRPDTLAGLQPLYQAVIHGCLAERYLDACEGVFFDRIRRGHSGYSVCKLGAVHSDLGASAAFFDSQWNRSSSNLSPSWHGWLLAVAAFSLRALGRLAEAIELMRAASDMAALAEDWKYASVRANNLSEFEVTIGDLDAAVSDGENAIEYADRCGIPRHQISNRTATADALHQLGELDSASNLFAHAEQMQQEYQPEFPRLYKISGFRYAELLLTCSERCAWQVLMTGSRHSIDGIPNSVLMAACDDAKYRAERSTEYATMKKLGLLTVALDHLTLARTSLYVAILESDSQSKCPPRNRAAQNSNEGEYSISSDAVDLLFASETATDYKAKDESDRVDIARNVRFGLAEHHLEKSLTCLRKAGRTDHLPKALLTAAMLLSLQGGSGKEQAFAHLLEAEQIATRGPMPLFLADIHLTRARIAGRMNSEGGTLKVDVSAELTKARHLIEEHNYGRRIEELEDAEAALFKK